MESIDLPAFPHAPQPRTLREALDLLEETRRALADECRARESAVADLATSSAHADRLGKELGDARVSCLNKSTRIRELETQLEAQQRVSTGLLTDKLSAEAELTRARRELEVMVSSQR